MSKPLTVVGRKEKTNVFVVMDNSKLTSRVYNAPDVYAGSKRIKGIKGISSRVLEDGTNEVTFTVHNPEWFKQTRTR